MCGVRSRAWQLAGLQWQACTAAHATATPPPRPGPCPTCLAGLALGRRVLAGTGGTAVLVLARFAAEHGNLHRWVRGHICLALPPPQHAAQRAPPPAPYAAHNQPTCAADTSTRSSVRYRTATPVMTPASFLRYRTGPQGISTRCWCWQRLPLAAHTARTCLLSRSPLQSLRRLHPAPPCAAQPRHTPLPATHCAPSLSLGAMRLTSHSPAACPRLLARRLDEAGSGSAPPSAPTFTTCRCTATASGRVACGRTGRKGERMRGTRFPAPVGGQPQPVPRRTPQPRRHCAAPLGPGRLAGRPPR